MILSSLLLAAVSACLRVTVPADGSAVPSKTYEERDPNTGRPVRCDRCPPGTYLRARCSATRPSDCAPCPQGSFTELWNHIDRCLRCGVCGDNQVVQTACTATTDCECACAEGFYYKEEYDACVRHSRCPTGSGVLSPGTPAKDTVCQTCPNGTYSDISSAQQNCSDHTRCSHAGLQRVLKGAAWHDSVCADCNELKDGAHYFKEIIPAFFLHHHINVNRLRRIVNKLPTPDGKKQAGTSNLDVPELQARIDSWLKSATEEQIRELPAIVTKSGASGAGKRLENKLQQVDTALKQDCIQGNEVELDLMSSKTKIESLLAL